QLQHENILPLLGFSRDFGPFPAMVSPWMHNGTLNIYLRHNFTELMIESKLRIVSCFSKLHAAGIVHGELTANNILIDSNRNALVADHGILALCPESPNTSYLRNNVRWAAPELFEESSTPLKPSSDIYAFGCIMFQVMTGQQPYADVHDTYQVTSMIFHGKKPARPSSPPIADPLWDLIQRCWSDRPSRRPSAVEVLRFLGSDQVTSLEFQ
ncbi:kinase-like domain-containing protein, partial [Suillus clintonianus]|uniref:kinase-like domain-containing protein n=1 Tax=Suillus clintonianus TaxID=1904413 RepID=UPI001B87B007